MLTSYVLMEINAKAFLWLIIKDKECSFNVPVACSTAAGYISTRHPFLLVMQNYFNKSDRYQYVGLVWLVGDGFIYAVWTILNHYGFIHLNFYQRQAGYLTDTYKRSMIFARRVVDVPFLWPFSLRSVTYFALYHHFWLSPFISYRISFPLHLCLSFSHWVFGLSL